MVTGGLLTKGKLGDRAGAFGGLRGFSNGLAMAKRKGKWGYIDKKGDWIIEPIYDHVHPFNEGASNRIGERWMDDNQ